MPKNCRSDWETFAQLDPKWAVLTQPDKKHNRWDEGDFFATGIREIDSFLEKLKQLQIDISLGSALDFGCGLGRLSSALAQHFNYVTGIDISAEMVARARELHQGNYRLSFVHNPASDLACLESDKFDLVYSFITLQHVPRQDAIKNYLCEFLRVLKPAGLLYFQLPSVPDYSPMRSALLCARGFIFRLFTRVGVSPKFCFSHLRLAPYMHMTHIPSSQIKTLFESQATLVHLENDHQTNTAYLFRKNS